MKTTQGRALDAYKAVSGMGQKSMKTGTALKLFKLKKALESSFEFYRERETALITECGGTIAENGVKFPDPEKQFQFLQGRKELNEMEIDLEITPARIAGAELPEITLNELESLDGFVTFE